MAGLQELKQRLGLSYANLVPGCNAEALKAEGLKVISRWQAEKKAAQQY